MLSYLLGWTVGLGSLGLYLTGFLLPETRRKNDAIWSGTGLIYALSILVDAGRTPAGLQIGQLSGALLLGWLGWQTLQQRRQLSEDLQTPIPASAQEIFPFVKQGWNRLVATYKNPVDDGKDVLVTGVKKVSALIGGSEESGISVELPDRFKDQAAADLSAVNDDAVELPDRFKAQAAAADLDAVDDDEDWVEGGASPAATVNPQPDPSSSSVDLPSRYKAPVDASQPEAADAEDSSTPVLTGPDDFSPSVVVPLESVTAEVRTDILPANPPEASTDLNLPTSIELEPVDTVSPEVPTPDKHPDRAPQIDAVVIEETSPPAEAEVMPSDPEPESAVDLSDRSAEATAAEERDEDWPPKESTI